MRANPKNKQSLLLCLKLANPNQRRNNGIRKLPSVDYQEMATSLENWSKTDNATALVQFCNLHDTYPQKIYEWRDASPIFSESLKKAKARIAERLRAQLHAGTTNYGLFTRVRFS